MTEKYWLWSIWAIFTLMLSAVFGMKMFLPQQDKSIFLPGNTSHGHYQIEMVCDSCHMQSFSDRDTIQQACEGCHADELKAVDDSHPKSKFTDPRNFDRIEKLDARFCVTCHVEHRSEITLNMGLTTAADVCFHCHSDIAEDRPTHMGLSFDTCAVAGCHNFHDNKALYEDFLLKHAGDKNDQDISEVPLRDFKKQIPHIDSYPLSEYPLVTLGLEQADGSEEYQREIENGAPVVEGWHQSAHASAGVNCSACHHDTNENVWLEKPNHEQCVACHDHEVEGFLLGKHGMRIAAKLSPMSPGLSRIPMKESSHNKQLTCSSCHSSHQYDTKYAAVDACLECHDDQHSNAYKQSKHYQRWLIKGSVSDEVLPGISCSGCHMPRFEIGYSGFRRVLVLHNQSSNLRPNEKMIRSVCMRCHSLTFSIDALADSDLVEKNFFGQPAEHILSIDMALQNRIRDQSRRKAMD